MGPACAASKVSTLLQHQVEADRETDRPLFLRWRGKEFEQGTVSSGSFDLLRSLRMANMYKVL
jgi:hypothetical protein